MSSPRHPLQFDLKCEEFIVEFDQARGSTASVDIDAMIEQVSPDQRPRLVAEIACVDLEHAFGRGEDVRISPFLGLYPDVFQDVGLREEVAREHYRQCCVWGRAASRHDIATRYGLDAPTWEELPKLVGSRSSETDVNTELPRVGTTFCGYPLVAELGRGALARVYLARQPDLAQRWVVLKVTGRITAESDRLAGLRHSGIIPVYSIHQADGLYAICMPYLGAVTLADLLADGRLFNHQGSERQELISTFVAGRLSTIVSTLPGRSSSADEEPASISAEQDHGRSVQQVIDKDGFEKMLGLDELAQALQRRFFCQNLLMAKVSFLRQLAEAVGYAHLRGVVHRDLKPQNVLVANDGKPVVLDFNLAVSHSGKETCLVGGTLPYMSPQQLRSLESHGRVAPQDDVFSLGVIFYQILTGKLPYEVENTTAADLETIATMHAMEPPRVRGLGISIPPSLNAILMKCLAAAESDRYANATLLCEDLLRFETHQVLQHAADRSPVERMRKWVRRHPIATSTSSIIAVSLLAIAGLATAFMVSHQRAARLEATNRANSLGHQLPETLAMLRTPGGESELVEKGLIDGARWLNAWSVTEGGFAPDSTWNRLEPSQRSDVARQLGDLLYSMAGARAHLALVSSDQRERLLADAKKLNQLAAQVFPDLLTAVNVRNAKIDAFLNIPSSVLSDSQAKFLPNTDSLFVKMLVARESGDTELWLQLADQLVAEQPVDPTRWFTLASAKFAKGDFQSASDAFDVSAKLQQRSAMSTFWRGVSRLRAGEVAKAKEDFSECIALRADWLAPRYNRALASRATRTYEDAIADLTWIVNSGSAGPRVFSLKSQLWLAVGDKTNSEKDKAQALQATPQDADDWVVQGVLKIATAPHEALGDFEMALSIDSRHVAARVNTAHVQSEMLQDNDSAIGTLTSLIDSGLGGTSAIASRGILRAREDATQQAIEDARLTAKSSPSALEMLQIAGIYAICSRGEEDVAAAIAWLAKSLAADPNLKRLAASDPDLTKLRGSEIFRTLVAAKSNSKSSE